MSGRSVCAGTQRCCGTATRCPLLLAAPFPLHLPRRFTAGIALTQQPLPAPVTTVVVGRLPVFRGHAQGRTRTLLAYPEDRTHQRKRDGGDTEKRWWGHDKAQSLTLLCAPSTSDESQISPNLCPPASKFTFNLFGFVSHFVSPRPSHTPPTTRPGWTQRG